MKALGHVTADVWISNACMIEHDLGNDSLRAIYYNLFAPSVHTKTWMLQHTYHSLPTDEARMLYILNSFRRLTETQEWLSNILAKEKYFIF